MKKIKIVPLMSTAMFLTMQTTAFAGTNETTNNELALLKDDVSVLVNYAIGFALLTSVLIFIIHFLRLASANSDPRKRSAVLHDITTTIIITALLGGIGVISKIFVNMFA